MNINESIEYLGLQGVTESCLEALRRFILFGSSIRSARIISAGTKHALLLLINEADMVIIRSGFTSGYPGEGPAGLAEAITLLKHHDIHLDEVEVDTACLRRLNDAALTAADLKQIRHGRVVQPSRLYDYQRNARPGQETPDGVYRRFPVTIPYRILDKRLLDLALKFLKDSDSAILTAWRRLEDVVRARSGVDEHGTKLFSRAFGGNRAPLRWPDVVHDNEVIGRVQMFTGAYMAYRNPQAHAERADDANAEAMLVPFLTVNQLFLLERKALAAPAEDPEAGAALVTQGT